MLKVKAFYSFIIFNFNQYRLFVGRSIFARMTNRRIQRNQIKCVHLDWNGAAWRDGKLIPNYGGFMFLVFFGRFLGEIGVDSCIEFSFGNIPHKIQSDYKRELNTLIQRYLPTNLPPHFPRDGCWDLAKEAARLRFVNNVDQCFDKYLPSIIHHYSEGLNYSNIRITRQKLIKRHSCFQESLKVIWGHRRDSVDPVRNSNFSNFFLILHSLLKISDKVEIVNIGTPELIVQLETTFQRHLATCGLCEDSRISFESNSYVTNTELILDGSLYLSDSRNGLTDFAFISEVPSLLISPKWRNHANRSGQYFIWKTENQHWLDSDISSDRILISKLIDLSKSILLGDK